MSAGDVLLDVLAADKCQEQADIIDDALWQERRQTQRRMIAALYWRAGEHRAESERATHAAPECLATASGVLEYALREHRNHMAVWGVADAMEAACPR